MYQDTGIFKRYLYLKKLVGVKSFDNALYYFIVTPSLSIELAGVRY
jgi:hypothetical protein